MKAKIIYDIRAKAEVGHELIPIPLYNCDVFVFFPEQNAILNKYKSWEMEGKGGGVYDFLDDNAEVWVRFHRLKYNVIAHEVNHIVTNILHSRGHDFNKSYDEPMAYLTGYIMGEIIKLAKKKKLRIKQE